VRKIGLFEEADKGTIFLDEIGEMEPAVQTKLLRVLEERKIRRVGGTKSIEIDVRVIAATNRDLTAAIRSGQFREDLFYRLNVFPIQVPPLRERKEDIPILAKFYLERYNRAFSRNFQEIAPEALELLIKYQWPGNIRELKNAMERISIMHNGPTLLPGHLPLELHQAGQPEIVPRNAISADSQLGLEKRIEQYERAIIEDALRNTGGNVLQAAQILMVPRGTLRYKMTKYGL
jgi:transcriptional regulator with PAS, ATPase and Fis domain